MRNKSFESDRDARDRAVLAIDWVLAGLEWQWGRPLNSIYKDFPSFCKNELFAGLERGL